MVQTQLIVLLLLVGSLSAQVLRLPNGGTGNSTFTASRCVQVKSDGSKLESAAGPCASGSGTVTDVFSAFTGVSPFFSCTVSNPTTTPSISCTTSTIAAHNVLGNNTGSTATIAAVRLACADLSDSGAGCSGSGSSGTVTNIATSAPITGGPITTTGTIGIAQATTLTDGYLSSTDWNTFNGKQAAIAGNTLASHFFANSINSAGTISGAHLACADLSDAGSGCSGATSSGGTVTTTGSPASGNLTKFSGSTSVTNGDLSGDVTTSGTLVTTLGNIPTATPMAGSVLATNITAPGTPASGKDSIYVDSTDKRLHDKNDAGTVATTVVAATAPGGEFVTGISTAGVLAYGTPAGSSSAGGIFPALSPPASANFSWVNQLSTTVTDYSNREVFQPPQNGTDPNWRLWIASASLPAHHQIDVAFTWAMLNWNYVDFGIGLRASGSGNFISFAIDVHNSTYARLRIIRFNSVTSVSSVPNADDMVTPHLSPGLLFLRITDDGSTRKYWFSTNGWDYLLYASEATNTFITPNQAMMVFANFGSGSTPPIIGAWHWGIQ